METKTTKNSDYSILFPIFVRPVIWLAVFAFAFTIVIGHAKSQGLTGSVSQELGSEQTTGTHVDEILNAIHSGGVRIADVRKIEGIKKGKRQPDQNSGILAESPKIIKSTVLDSDAIQGFELEGGIATGSKALEDYDDPTVFKLAVKFFEKVIFRGKAEFAERPKFEEGLDISGTPTFDKDTAGFAVIKKGNQSVEVEFKHKYEYSPVVTATLSLQQYDDESLRAAAADLLLISDVKYIVTDVTKKGFQIMMDRAADSDIPFSWHALAVKNPKTFKKAGDVFDFGDHVLESEQVPIEPTIDDLSLLNNESSAAGTRSEAFSLTRASALRNDPPDRN